MTPSIDVFGLPSDGGALPSSADSPYSALLQTFWVLQGHSLPWASLASQLDLLLVAPHLVVLYEAWWPKRERRRQTFARILSSHPESSGNTALAILERGHSVSDVLKAYEECGGVSSGQWLLAAPYESSDALIRELRGGFGQPAGLLAAKVAPHFLCALTIDEGAQTELFVRRDHPAFAAFVTLLDELRKNP